MCATHIMLDIETLGVGYDSVICSIGAVKFNKDGIIQGSEFYHNIDVESCTKIGLKMDIQAIKWWFKQDHKVFKQLFVNPQPIIKVLKLFLYTSLPTSVIILSP